MEKESKEHRDNRRFWFYVKDSGPDECWPWESGISGDGYGLFTIDKHIQIRSHRHAYFLSFGRIDNDLVVCHSCDNPVCCNPHHLFLGTALDNTRDMVEKRRHAYGTRNNKAKITDAQVIEICDLYARGEFTQPELAHQFGITQMNIWQIVSGRSWKHVPRRITKCGRGQRYKFFTDSK